MNRRYFITGTDTGVGKTVVTASLMAAFQDRGVRCLPVKPIQTGYDSGHDDLHWCLSFSSQPLTECDRKLLSMYRLPLPASPHLAAEQTNTRIDVQSLEKSIAALSNDWNILLIEGAGGLLVPVNESHTMLDLITAFKAEPIVVTHSGLGTLNHTALTLHELDRRHLTPAAIVINDRQPVQHATDITIRNDNIKQIGRLAGAIPVVVFDYIPVMDKPSLLNLGRKLVGLPSLTGIST